MTHGELRRRLLDWLDDVHECNSIEQMSDADLADSLILFIEQVQLDMFGEAS